MRITAASEKGIEERKSGLRKRLDSASSTHEETANQGLNHARLHEEPVPPYSGGTRSARRINRELDGAAPAAGGVVLVRREADAMAAGSPSIARGGGHHRSRRIRSKGDRGCSRCRRRRHSSRQGPGANGTLQTSMHAANTSRNPSPHGAGSVSTPTTKPMPVVAVPSATWKGPKQRWCVCS